MNKEKTNLVPLAIAAEDILILKKEGDKALAICTSLNANKEFMGAAAAFANEAFQGNQYRAEHILLRDIVKIFNDFAALHDGDDKIPVKAKIILIYLYEKLQGRDLVETYDLKKINALTLAAQFDKNVNIIRGTSFFQSTAEMDKEFALPAILLKIKK